MFAHPRNLARRAWAHGAGSGSTESRGRAEHGIASDIEVIAIQQINEAYARMLRSDVRYRFVIDMASLAAG